MHDLVNDCLNFILNNHAMHIIAKDKGIAEMHEQASGGLVRGQVLMK